MYKQIQIDIINHLMLANKLPDEELQLIKFVIDVSEIDTPINIFSLSRYYDLL